MGWFDNWTFTQIMLIYLDLNIYTNNVNISRFVNIFHLSLIIDYKCLWIYLDTQVLSKCESPRSASISIPEREG